MSNRIVTRYASFLLAAFVFAGCSDDEPTGIDTLPWETTPRSVGILQGATTQIGVTGIAAGDVTWSSSDVTIATVNSAGLVSGVGAGTTAINATAKSDGTIISSNVTVTAVPTLTSGVARTGISGTPGNPPYFKVIVPAGSTNLSIVMSGGTGDADIHVRFGALPTLSQFDCRPWAGGNNETCTFTPPQVGTYFIMIDPYVAFSGVSLVATITP